MSWSTFLKAHWPRLAAIDFATVEVWTKGGLVTHYVLFVMELATRRVACAGITPHPGAAWMLQIGRNLTDAFSGFLHGKSLHIVDRDSSFHEAFRSLLKQKESVRCGFRRDRRIATPTLSASTVHLKRRSPSG